MMEGLQKAICEALAGASTTAPYALIDYPNYLNPGDAAIWVGTRRALEVVNGRPPAYTSTLRGFSASRCRSLIGPGTIYFLGGGNFGDLYARHQRLRLAVLRAMPGNPVVQLPFSCAWTEEGAGKLLFETIDIYRKHSSIKLFSRDALAQRDLEIRCGLQSVLCPDLCHMIEFSAPPPKQEVVRLMRRDPEATGHQAAASIDWRDSVGQRFTNRIGKLLLAAVPSGLRLTVQDRVARRKVTLALEILSQGRVVETDRLHAALLAAAIGRKVVLVDNKTGKVLAYRETWKHLLPDLFAFP